MITTPKKQMDEPGESLFDLETVFEVDDYMFAYGSELTEERTRAEVEFWVRLLEIDSPMRILDLACGFGRHANRLASLGHTVTGLDLMPGFIELARREAAKMGLPVDYRQGDMRRIEYIDQFDRVLLLFTSFGYFEDTENLHVLQKAARALKPGGLLGLDTLNRDVFAADPPSTEVIDRDGSLLINRVSYESATRRLQNRRIVVRDGVRKDKPFSIRLYDPDEMRNLMQAAGLELKKLVGSDGLPVTDGSRRLQVVARRPAVI